MTTAVKELVKAKPKWFTSCLGCGAHFEGEELLDKCPKCEGRRFIVQLAHSGSKYFDCERDAGIISTGGFFCLSCLIGKPGSEQSSDSRYCQSCQDFLTEEAKTLLQSGNHHRPEWIPQGLSLGASKAEDGGKTSAPYQVDGRTIMSTLNSEKNTVAIIPPRVAIRPSSKRGPKFRDLPVNFIRELAGLGHGPKAIATRLKADGIAVSYKTVQRVLAGQRVFA